MHALNAEHPAQLCLGTVMIAEEMATKGRQTTFAMLARDAVEWATETRDLLREIATDASQLADDITAAAADGIITPEERVSLHESARQIESEAQSGLIES